jgi:hypothetical protein
MLHIVQLPSLALDSSLMVPVACAPCVLIVPGFHSSRRQRHDLDSKLLTSLLVGCKLHNGESCKQHIKRMKG